MTMWPLAASGGWPPARGYLHSESVNAQRMRPYMPGGRWRGGPYKRGTTVYVVGVSKVRYLPVFLCVWCNLS